MQGVQGQEGHWGAGGVLLGCGGEREVLEGEDKLEERAGNDVVVVSEEAGVACTRLPPGRGKIEPVCRKNKSLVN